jgi:hypothetical protein
VEPALAALLFRAAVPGEPSAGHGDQVLLQRINPEGVGDLVIVQPAVGTGCMHHKLVTLAGESGRDAEMFELGAGEVAEHGCLGGFLHRQRMVRTLPARGFGLVASKTDLAADVARRLIRVRAGYSAGRGQREQHDRRGAPQEDRRVRQRHHATTLPSTISQLG